jgi:hypothetical protein
MQQRASREGGEWGAGHCPVGRGGGDQIQISIKADNVWEYSLLLRAGWEELGGRWSKAVRVSWECGSVAH